MAGFLNEFITRTKDTAETVYRKSDEYIRLTRLKLQVVRLKSEIRNCYEELGTRVYEMYSTGKEDTSELLQRTMAIDALGKRVKDIEGKINELSHFSSCPNCGEKNKLHSAYCSNCGTRLTATEEAVEENENQMPDETVDS